MNCEEFRAGYVAGEEGSRYESHLACCPECQIEIPRLRETRRALEDELIWEEPPDGTAARVVATVAARVGPADRPRSWAWAAVGAAVAVAIVLAIGAASQLVDRPSWEVAMAGVGPVPAAQGTVAGWNTESGTRLVLTIENLPPAPAGFYYELWLSSPDRVVSAGTFRAPEDVVLWTAAFRSELPRLTITLEPVDGDPLPSGEAVLISDA
jgi:anti-sigma-K factor RskA